MPNFVSHKGKWYAAKEKIALTNKSDKPIKYKGETIQPGEPFIYVGADREALKSLNEAGQEHLGVDFRQDPEFLQAVRNMGFQSGKDGVSEYLEMIGFDEKAHDEMFEKNAEVINKHDLPKKVKENKIMGGGKDTTGNKENNILGGFGDQRIRPEKELATTAKEK